MATKTTTATSEPEASSSAENRHQRDAHSAAETGDGGGSGSSSGRSLGRCGWQEYEQILTNNPGHSLPSDAWADALLELESSGRLPQPELMSRYRSALSSCPYSVRLWCQLADCQVRAGAPWHEVRDTCEAALNSGLHRESELAALTDKLNSCAALYHR